MLKMLLTLTGTLLFIGCSSLQNSSKNTTYQLSLANVVLEEHSFTGKHLKSIGTPEMVRSIPVSITERPFTYNSYKKYLKNLGPSNKNSSIEFSDSLEIKPTYYQLELADQVDLQRILNAEENMDFRSYVARNERYAIVFKASMTVPDVMRSVISTAEAVFLTETESGIALAFLENGTRITLPFPKENVFDYELCSFCWGEARYSEKRVEAIVSYKTGCPEGTEKNANKLDGTKEYLKL